MQVFVLLVPDPSGEGERYDSVHGTLIDAMDRAIRHILDNGYCENEKELQPHYIWQYDAINKWFEKNGHYIKVEEV